MLGPGKGQGPVKVHRLPVAAFAQHKLPPFWRIFPPKLVRPRVADMAAGSPIVLGQHAGERVPHWKRHVRNVANRVLYWGKRNVRNVAKSNLNWKCHVRNVAKRIPYWKCNVRNVAKSNLNWKRNVRNVAKSNLNWKCNVRNVAKRFPYCTAIQYIRSVARKDPVQKVKCQKPVARLLIIRKRDDKICF